MWYNLMTGEEWENTEFVLSLSYGKDSLAAIHVAIDILGWRIDRIVHAEVWATDTIPADLPPMVEFKRWADGYIKGRWGLTVEHVYATRGGGNAPSATPSTSVTSEESTSASCEDFRCSEGRGAKTGSNGQPLEKLTYEKLFYHIPERKNPDNPNRGGYTGWPYQQGPWCNTKLKVRVDFGISDQVGTLVQLRSQEDSHTAFQSAAPTEGTGVPSSSQEFSQSPRRRGAKKNIVHILGIAADEPERIARYIDKPGYLLPLVEANWDEDMCGLWCKYEGLLSPVYENACRSGCWFCHNQGVDQLRLLRRNYPNLWKLLLKWDLDSPVTFKADGHTVHDFDRRFAMEDERKIPTDRRFRWAMLDVPPKFVAYEGEQISMRI